MVSRLKFVKSRRDYEIGNFESRLRQKYFLVSSMGNCGRISEITINKVKKSWVYHTTGYYTSL